MVVESHHAGLLEDKMIISTYISAGPEGREIITANIDRLEKYDSCTLARAVITGIDNISRRQGSGRRV